jgi:hypothetical protein
MRIIIFALVVVFAGIGCAVGAWDVNLETGYASSGYNNLRIPGNSGSWISLNTDLAIEGTPFYRLRVTKDVGTDSYLSVLYAPFTLNAKGTTAGPVVFNGTTFPAGRVSGSYRFDSYRLTYGRRFRSDKPLSWKVGFTAKIRDAAVELSDGTRTSVKKNTGFVPLLNLGVQQKISQSFSLLIDADALAGGPGRAEDVLFAALWKSQKGIAYYAGYRFVEGGADTSEVYTFCLINYLSIGVSVPF